MSQELISHSPDLKKLRDEGYEIEARSGHLLVKHVPYVTAQKEVKYAILVSTLRLAGDRTDKPDTHVVYFTGEYPCKVDGSRITGLEHGSARQELLPGVVVEHSFSNKPPDGYPDYHAKMTRYVKIISVQAEAIDPNATARTHPVYEATEEESVFKYIDTASSRAQITLATKKLELAKVAIIGLGGTGSYVLDLVAKTPVKEIHLFDGDVFSQHNAFRSPGAPTVGELRQRLTKAVFFKEKYSPMRRGLVDHAAFIDATNVDSLQQMDFVFLCLDKGAAKKLIVDKLEEFGKPFIDVGMGIELRNDKLMGILRTTTSTAAVRIAKRRIPFQDGGADNEYDTNIQIADVNALNAALAVIKWKKLYEFYWDLEKEHNSTYVISGNDVNNEEQQA
ncbi:MAG: ThiF family adenylyltransferase [Gammaproteobacteria bacterium]